MTPLRAHREVQRPQFLPREEGAENERGMENQREEISSSSSSEASSDSLGERIENELQKIEEEETMKDLALGF